MKNNDTNEIFESDLRLLIYRLVLTAIARPIGYENRSIREKSD